MLCSMFLALMMMPTISALAQDSSKVLVAVGKEVRTETISPGTVTCENGQPTGQIPPCSPSTTKIVLRGMSNKYVAQDVSGTATAYLGGWNITNVNADLDSGWYGHMWGTAEWTVPDMGGVWQGTFSVVADQGKGIVVNKAIFYGSGGKLEGLKMEFYAVTMGTESTFIAFITKQ